MPELPEWLIETPRQNKRRMIERLSFPVQMEPSGIEPPTSALRTQEPGVLTTENKALADDAPAACTTACTDKPENANAGDFAEALLMLTRLPLTDAERAEAVRRLLATSRDNARQEARP